MRSTFAEEQGGVFLGLVEVRRKNNPSEHILAITGLYPTLLNSRFGQLVENVLVLEGQLYDFSLFGLLEIGCDDVKVGR